MKKNLMLVIVCFFLFATGCKPTGSSQITGSWFCNDDAAHYYYTFNLYDDDISTSTIQTNAVNAVVSWATVLKRNNNQKRIIFQWLDTEATDRVLGSTYHKLEWSGDTPATSITLRFYSGNNDLEAAENETAYHERVYERKIPL